MDRIIRWEWRGNMLLLVLLCFTVILLPVGVVYFMTRLLRIEESVGDATKLSEFLDHKA